MTMLEMEDVLRAMIERALDYIANPIEDNYRDLCDVTILASAELCKHVKEQDHYHDEEERSADRD
jgi:hypothetical protein